MCHVKFLSLEQAVAAVMESDYEEQHDIVILPPIENAEDSEVEDIDENTLCSEDAADADGQLELHSSSIQLHVEEKKHYYVSKNDQSFNLNGKRWTKQH